MTDTSAVIRKALARDATPIAKVHVQCWREAYAGIVPQETLDAMSVDERSERWTRILKAGPDDPAFAVFVAEKDGVLVGFGSVASQRDDRLAKKGFKGEFTAIYLLASCHGCGIGQRLMDAMRRHLISAGIEAASLWVLEGNGRARRFYEKMGGQTLGVERRDTALSEIAYGWRDMGGLAPASWRD